MKRVKNFYNDFKKFITKGNVVDLAVAVIIGAAFGKIVTSLVNDIIMPLLTAALGAHSLTDLVWTLRDAVVVDGVVTKEALTINWGSFLQNIVDFLLISLIIFVMIRLMTSAKKAAEKLAANAKELIGVNTDEQSAPEPVAEAAPPAVAEQANLSHIEELLSEIRDALKEGKQKAE